MAEGVLYIARGDRYVEAAVQSAQSVRRVNPGIPIAIATDGPAPAEFDEAIALTEADGYRAKILGMIASPFDRTLMLDVDTYVVGEISEVFGILDAFDVAAAHAPQRCRTGPGLGTPPTDRPPHTCPRRASVSGRTVS